MNNLKSCEEYREMINSYIDFELTRTERMEVEAHMEECSKCAAYCQHLEKLFGEQYTPMPHSVAGAVMNKIHTEIDSNEDPFAGPEKIKRIAKKKQWSKNFKTWGAIAAVCVLVLTTSIVGYLMGNDNSTDVALSSAAYATADKDATGTASENALGQSSDGTVVSTENGEIANYSAVLVSAIREADSIVVKFGANQTEVTDNALIEEFAAYLEALPCAIINDTAQGHLGYIKTNPDCGLEIYITENHTIVFDDGIDIIELTAERDSFLDMLDKLGA